MHFLKRRCQGDNICLPELSETCIHIFIIQFSTQSCLAGHQFRVGHCSIHFWCRLSVKGPIQTIYSAQERTGDLFVQAVCCATRQGPKPANASVLEIRPQYYTGAATRKSDNTPTCRSHTPAFWPARLYLVRGEPTLGAHVCIPCHIHNTFSAHTHTHTHYRKKCQHGGVITICTRATQSVCVCVCLCVCEATHTS